MKRFALIIAVILSAGIGSVFAATTASPVIFYSDLTSGPKTGGKDNNGVFVTIAGKNFGSSRGSGSVSVGGGQAANYPVWTDNKISFQLGAAANSGDIVVTTPEGSSNGIHFTVREGRIFFVDINARGNGSGSYEDPWKSPASFFKEQKPGDTCYFRNGVYSEKYGNASRSYNVSFYNAGAPSGAKDNEIAWVGYPGETAQFRANDNNVYNGAFEVSGPEYMVIAGFSIYARGDGRENVRLYSDNNKLVNCRIEGVKSLSYAMIGVTASNLKIWGNEMFGATSRNKLDHIIYFQTGRQNDNDDIGWNYIHDNDINVGPVFSWNLDNGNGTSWNINIHDNKIDCRNSSAVVRLAGIWNGSDGSITFANNIVIGAGGSMNNDNSYNAIYAGFGKISVYHNTFYQSQGAGSNSVINFYGKGSGIVKNNIFYNKNNIGYINGNASIDSNLYYGGAGNVPSADAHAVTADPKFTNPSSLDFHIASDSPANGKGADVTAAVPRDYDGVSRKGAPAIGAFQYYEGGALTTPGTDATTTESGISGTIKNLQGKAITGVSVRLVDSGDATSTTGEDGVYHLTGVPQGTHVITASKDGFGFTPESRKVTKLNKLGANVTGQDFVARRAARLEGNAKDAAGGGIADARVTLLGEKGTPEKVSTDKNGHYAFNTLEGFSYTVKIDKSGYAFEPPTRIVSASGNAVIGQDFSAVDVAQMLSAGEIKVIGPAANKGVVNPSKGETAQIYFQGAATGKFECRIFNLSGDIVWESSMDNVQSGTFEWSPASVASGIYLANIQGPGVKDTKKIAIIQ